jgi:hypothetical protein
MGQIDGKTEAKKVHFPRAAAQEIGGRKQKSLDGM